MILWTMKLYGFVRKAIAGRRHPGQLAWAVAFGLLLGIVPHGNLLAIAILVIVLSLKLNHAMAMLTAVGASFLAVKLDPASHAVGEYLFAQPKFAEFATKAWAMPMMPWTDLNNTIVLGSLTIGLVALIPVFMITYPFFRIFVPKESVDAEESESTADREAADRKEASHPPRERIVYVDRGSQAVPPPHHEQNPARQPAVREHGQRIDFAEISPAASQEQPQHPAAPVQTRIDVIRVKEPGQAASPQGVVANAGPDAETSPDPNQPPQPMDEALNYLLRQLRDSQQRNAA